jgi:predicted nucleic acid-binding protein
VQYVDTSALLKRYVLEPDSGSAERVLQMDPEWVTAAHTEVEVRRNLARRLGGDPRLLAAARAAFAADWASIHVVALDGRTCGLAADLAETTGARSLDALHLAAAQRAGAPSLRLVAFDVRLAQTARSLGWTVVGA